MKFFTMDITESGEKLIAHGCNAQGKMGSGVALAIATKWPVVKERYLSFMASHRSKQPSELLGLYGWAKADEQTTVFNLITQENYGKDRKKYASYWAIYESLNDIVKYWGQQHIAAAVATHTRFSSDPNDYQPFVIAIPRIGCGLGGLQWEFVEALLLELEEKYRNYELEFHVYDV